jgi:hypothetical protein
MKQNETPLSPGSLVPPRKREFTFKLADEDIDFLWYALGAAMGSALKSNEMELAERFQALFYKLQSQTL